MFKVKPVGTKPSTATVSSARGRLNTALTQGHTAQHPSVAGAMQTLKAAGQAPKLTPGQAGKANQ